MKSVFGGPVRGHVQVELLSAYLDQQASPAERAYIDAHLHQCLECRAELDSLRRTVTLLHAIPRVALPRAFTLSEAQVGIRQPATAPGWFGGLMRGFGAVAAIALVAFVAFTVLRPDEAPWNPTQSVARVAPTTGVTETAPQAGMAAAEKPVQAAPTPAPLPTLPVETAAPVAAPATEPPAVESAPAIAMAPAPSETAADSAGAAASAAANTSAPTSATTGAAESAATLAPTTAPQLATKAGPTDTGPTEVAPMMGAATMGRGGGGGGGPSEPMGIPPQYLTPEATPASRGLATTLPSGLRFAYADLNALWAVDRDGGARQLVQGRGINTPQLSPDQEWIVYRTYSDQGLQVWAVRWEGGDSKLLLDDAKLPTDNLPAGYERRAISDTRWEPQGNVLAVTLSLVPGPDSPAPPKVELWRLDVQSGSLRFSSELGRAWRPFYSPDGKSYLVLQYGTEDEPEGSLSLVDTKSGTAKNLLTFPASPGKNGYDNQVAWAPNGRTAWVAIPTADYGTPVPPNGTKLYRVDAGGEAKEAGEIDAAQVNWSPTTDQMAYTRYTSDSMANNELYVANGDGSKPKLYTTMAQGEFISWSPQGDRFIYQDNFQVFEGAPGEPPKRLANATSIVGPRWISDTVLMSFHDTGSGWLLTLRDVDGEATGLLPLPREAMWDVGVR